MGTRSKAEGIVNFGEVTPTLYRGGLSSTAGLQSLKKLGVSVVVDMRGSANKAEEQAVTGLGMQYVSIPSHCPFPSDRPWARFLSVMRENRGKKVFVHCRLGDDRTGMAVAAYRMAEQGWSPEEAMNEMRAFGFTGVHHFICMGMAHYEKTFPRHLETSPAFRDLGLKDQKSK
jgi:protein tyrosine/serine phosphatase